MTVKFVKMLLQKSTGYAAAINEVRWQGKLSAGTVSLSGAIGTIFSRSDL